jgi:hypothetical protein
VARSASDTLRDYLEAQSRSAEEALQLVAVDAVFDVGRGRYEGHGEIREFLERLRKVNSQSSLLEVRDLSATEAEAVFDQRDDDLTPLGIDAIRLDVRVEVTLDSRIKTFTARPTPESIAALTAARQSGRSSDGLKLAERAGTIPPAGSDRS